MKSAVSRMLNKFISFLASDLNRLTAVFLFIFLFLSLFLFFDMYMPVYKVHEQKQFTGNEFYNPYKNYDNTAYYRANFHSYSRKSLQVYHQLGYGYAYHTNSILLDKYFPKLYISRHKTLFSQPKFLIFHPDIKLQTGSKYRNTTAIIFTNYSSIQYILNSIYAPNQSDNINTVLYPKDNLDIKYMPNLTNYHLIEILYGSVNSISYWDTALSNGRPAFLLASDKIENDETDSKNFAKSITMIPVSPASDNVSEILQALKTGAAYAYSLSDNITSLPMPDKLNTLNNLPQLLSIQINNNELTVKLNKSVDKIVFSADNGKIVKEVENTPQAAYNITDNESYVRITAYFDNGNAIYFNPVLKSENSMQQPKMPKSEINYPLSIIKWSIIIAAFIYLIITFISIEIEDNKMFNNPPVRRNPYNI